jgi:ubiquinone/menaquinone biosynthesis C-methylase UbiE
MASGDRREPRSTGKRVPRPPEPATSHWVRWHQPYDDPHSSLSLRLRTVQSMVRHVLDAVPASRPAPIRVVSLCAGQGRDVIDVVSSHPRGPEVSALLVELDPALASFARHRAATAAVADRVRVVEGDASLSGWYTEDVPADLVLVCGVFGNISRADITATIEAMRGFCRPGGHLVWTRHRRPPDATPAIRADLAAAGFTEVAFVAPEGTVMTVGHHRLDGATTPFDPDRVLFDFVGDGFAPA